MPNIDDLIGNITEILAEQKAYDLPSVCIRYGMANGEESEAFASKRTYVSKRLKTKSKNDVIAIATEIANDYNSPNLVKLLEAFTSHSIHQISSITRRNIIDEIILKGNLEGKLDIIDFVQRVWDTEKIPSNDFRFETATGEIWQHMENNSDWSYSDLLIQRFNILYTSDEIFLAFIEQVVHPAVREPEKQQEYVNCINKHLKVDNYELKISNYISNFPVYSAIDLKRGVTGNIKNLIFASTGPKPEIVLPDALNNDIKITKNEEFCLVYNRPISADGLTWKNLVSWWAKDNEITLDTERDLYKRLSNSLASKPEKTFFKAYYAEYRNKVTDFPALIPQVYLHYDPYTKKQRGESLFTHQRMDFLFIFSNKHRVVIEIDGDQHYSENNKPSPQLYSKMVSADRELKISGYDVFRFGGYELTRNNAEILICDFIHSLFDLYNIKIC